MTTTDRRRQLWIALALAVAATAGATDARGQTELATYEAVYRAEYRGHKVASTMMSLSYDVQRRVYRFESRSRAAGLLRFVRPNSSIERTEFVLHDGTVRPLEFESMDGSRNGEDNDHVVFDWDRGIAITDSGASTAPLEPGMLNVGTVLVALMRDVSRNLVPGPYVLTDGRSRTTYAYSAAGDETVEVEAGAFQTTVYEQEHEGSSRRTVYWLAPALEYLPVKILQYRDGELRLSLLLESVTGEVTNGAVELGPAP